MKLVIHTQYLENYAAHDWDGDGECPQHWKPKGGDTYVILNQTQEEIGKTDSPHLAEIYALVEHSSDYIRRYILSTEIATDDAQVCEEWETPIVIEKVDGKYIATEVTKNDEYSMLDPRIEEQRYSYTILPQGKRENATTTYLMKNGDLVDYQNMVEYMKATASNNSEISRPTM